MLVFIFKLVIVYISVREIPLSMNAVLLILRAAITHETNEKTIIYIILLDNFYCKLLATTI